ncbi:MAG TPA: hypothetical protein VMM12_18445 [Longimicrobiales bacterium]|nr:hypothetical protein [Longimicrobiales bacterium]
MIRPAPLLARGRLLALGALLAALTAALLHAAPAAAQEPEAARLLARADSAFEAGDRAAARVGYGEVLRLDPYRSRAVYQLGRLQPPGSAEQIHLFRRYTALEPEDAWGFAALGDACRDAGSVDDARAAYRQGLAIAPDAADIRAALAALPGTSPARAFSFEPHARDARDSDGNRTTEMGGGAAVRVGAGSIGIDAARVVVGDGVTSFDGWTAALDGEVRPRRALLLAARAGVLSVRDAATDAALTRPVGQARLRWRPERGVAVELRARHHPVTATPHLLASAVVLSEVRGTAELPLLGPLYARGVARHGALRDRAATQQDTLGGPGTGTPGGPGTGGPGGPAGPGDPGDVNTRTMVGGGPVLRLTPTLELSAIAGRSGYAHATTAGYFAPESVDILDAGIYWEHEGGRILFALDAGGGLERVKPFGAPRGGWGRSLRLWSRLDWSFGPAAALALEAEAYDTRGGEALVATEGGWRWGSLAASLVIRP